jgi:hypothetical protein
MKSLKITVLLCFILLFISCSQEKKEIVITQKNYHALVDKLTEVMIHDIFSPPVASRIYAYPNIAAYQVLNSKNGEYKSLDTQLNALKKIENDTLNDDANKPLAALIAYLDVAKELVFSKEKIMVFRDSLFNSWSLQNNSQFTKAKNYGLSVSSHIIKWMEKDLYKETRTMPEFNVYAKDPSRWQPTPPAYMKGIEPHWNKLRTFVLDSASQFKPIPHPKFSM